MASPIYLFLTILLMLEVPHEKGKKAVPANVVSDVDFLTRLAQTEQPTPREVFVFYTRPTLMEMQHYMFSRPLWPQADVPTPGELVQEIEFKVPSQSRLGVYEDLQGIAKLHSDVSLQVAFYEADDRGPKETHLMLVGPAKGKETKGRAVLTGVIREDRQVALLYMGFKPEGTPLSRERRPTEVVDITARRALRIQQEVSEQA